MGSLVLVHKLGSLSGYIGNCPALLPMEGRKREETDGSRWVGGNVSIQGELPRGLSWVPLEESISKPKGQNLEVSTEASTGFSHVYGLNNILLSQGCILERFLVWEE